MSKTKDLCRGCRNDFYNGEGAEECWSYKDAEVCVRYRIHWWTAPTVPGAFQKVTTLKCWHAPGQQSQVEQLPECAKP